MTPLKMSSQWNMLYNTDKLTPLTPLITHRTNSERRAAAAGATAEKPRLRPVDWPAAPAATPRGACSAPTPEVASGRTRGTARAAGGAAPSPTDDLIGQPAPVSAASERSCSGAAAALSINRRVTGGTELEIRNVCISPVTESRVSSSLQEELWTYVDIGDTDFKWHTELIPMH